MLESLRRDPAWCVEALVTTVNETNGRVAMHGTSESLLSAQAEALGLPVRIVGLPEDCDNRTYERTLAEGLSPFRQRGIDTVACGDLFLHDIRQWRERSFRRMGWQAVFPIWHTATDILARHLSKEPWRILVTCIDTHVLPERLLGARFDAELVARLPAGVDPCGENGEFHSFVCHGPGFRRPVEVRAGGRVLAHDRFLMLDLEAA